MKLFRISQIALAMLAVVAIAGQTQAGSVYNLSTGTADWQIVAKPAADPNPLGTALVIDPHNAWNSSLVDADTKWIGISSDGKSRGYAGDYVYRLDMVITEPGNYAVSGSYTCDNLLTSLKLNGVELLTSPSTDLKSFKKIFSFNSNNTGNITLEATVFNAPPPESQSDPKNPTGFILGGEVLIVPLPASAWAGLSMLGGLGLIRKLRRN